MAGLQASSTGSTWVCLQSAGAGAGSTGDVGSPPGVGAGSAGGVGSAPGSLVSSGRGVSFVVVELDVEPLPRLEPLEEEPEATTLFP